MAVGFLLIVGFAGAFGLAIGSFLNVVAYRVPAGISLTRESRCSGCDARVRPWQNIPVVSWLILRGSCASCGAPISPCYPIVEALTGVVFAGIVSAWLTVWPKPASVTADVLVLMAYLYLAAISIVLTLIDLDTIDSPNVIVMPSYIVAAGLFIAACVFGAAWGSLLQALIGMAALYGFYFVIRQIRPDGMGGGDVKLAGLLGLYLGWIGWGALAVGAFTAFLVGGLYGVALVLARRAGRRSPIPFGPWMIVGAWVGITAGETIGRMYVGLFQAQ